MSRSVTGSICWVGTIGMKRKFMIGLIVFEVIAGILVLLMMPGPRLRYLYVRTTWALPHGILGLVFKRPLAGWGIAWSDGMRFGARPSVIRKAETHVGRGIGSQTNDCPQKPASASWPKTYNWWKTFAFRNWREHPFDSTSAPQIQAVVLVGISGVCREYSPLVVLRRGMSTNDIPELDGCEFTFRSNALVEHLCQLPAQAHYPDLRADAWFAIYCAANHTVRGFRLFLRPSPSDFADELGVAAAISNEITRVQTDTP